MESYILIKNHDIFGEKGRVINYSTYSCLSDDHKLLFRRNVENKYIDKGFSKASSSYYYFKDDNVYPVPTDGIIEPKRKHK